METPYRTENGIDLFKGKVYYITNILLMLHGVCSVGWMIVSVFLQITHTYFINPSEPGSFLYTERYTSISAITIMLISFGAIIFPLFYYNWLPYRNLVTPTIFWITGLCVFAALQFMGLLLFWYGSIFIGDKNRLYLGTNTLAFIRLREYIFATGKNNRNIIMNANTANDPLNMCKHELYFCEFFEHVLSPRTSKCPAFLQADGTIRVIKASDLSLNEFCVAGISFAGAMTILQAVLLIMPLASWGFATTVKLTTRRVIDSVYRNPQTIQFIINKQE